MPDLHAGDSMSSRAEEQDSSTAQRAILGRILFAAYLAFYAGYVMVNAFAPTTIEQNHLFGINLAVHYGLALIFVAVLLSVIYEVLCRRLAARNSPPAEGRR